MKKVIDKKTDKMAGTTDIKTQKEAVARNLIKMIEVKR